jgi:hypothetical protein
MSNYYTTIDLVEGMFVGTVLNANTNAEVYKSKPYNSQSQASKDINIFLTTSKPPTTDPLPGIPAPGSDAIVNTIVYTPARTQSGGGCCGRR